MRPWILAAGLGMRRQPVSGAAPKPLMPLDAYRDHAERNSEGPGRRGFTEATIVGGHRGGSVRSRIGRGIRDCRTSTTTATTR